MEVQQITAEPHGFKKWEPLSVLSLALFIIVLDATLLNVSISTLIRDLHTTIRGIQWVITAYALILAAFTITGGRLGDLFGRKKMFMVGAAIFAIGSLTASFAHSLPVMIIGEAIIEGFGAALMMPATASLLVSIYHGHDRAVAFGIWGGVAGAGSAVGPLLGGWLTTYASWRWGFRINVAVVAILLIGAYMIKESYDTEQKKQFDWMGVLLSALGLLSIVYGVIESSTYGWWKALDTLKIGSTTLDFGISVTPVAIAVGIVLLALFVIWEMAHEKEGKTPLVSMKMFKNRQFTTGVLTVALLALSQAGMFFTLPVFLQSVLHLDAFHTGLALIPMSIAIFFSAPLAGKLSKKWAAKHIVQIGMFLSLIAVFLVRQVISADMHVANLIPGLALFGFGMGLVMGPISNLTLSAVPVSQAGEASGLNNTMRQVGQSFGAAILGAVLLTAISANSKTQAISIATANANKSVMTYTMLFAAIALLASFLIPTKRNLEQHPEPAPAAGH